MPVFDAIRYYIFFILIFFLPICMLNHELVVASVAKQSSILLYKKFKTGLLRYARNDILILSAILLLFNGLVHAQLDPEPSSKSSFNKLFKKITQAQPYTFFYHRPISPQGKVKIQPCAYCPIEEVNVVAMPIVPLEWLAKDLPCYQHKLCSKPNSLFYKGLSCCQKIDALYQKMSQDLHNFVPETRQMKQFRGQYVPAILPISDIELSIDKKKHLIHLPEAQRGIVARIYLYMAEKYQLKLDKDLKLTLESWDVLYAVTAWEKARNRLIYQEQGTYNRRIESGYPR